jgi:superoxide dismutase
MSDQTLQTLYESDFQVWVEKTIDCLEKQQFNRLDIQHLIEELTDLGRSDRKALESNLMILMAHRHWFSLIEGRKSYWAKVREIKKPI